MYLYKYCYVGRSTHIPPSIDVPERTYTTRAHTIGLSSCGDSLHPECMTSESGERSKRGWVRPHEHERIVTRVGSALHPHAPTDPPSPPRRRPRRAPCLQLSGASPIPLPPSPPAQVGPPPGAVPRLLVEGDAQGGGRGLGAAAGEQGKGGDVGSTVCVCGGEAGEGRGEVVGLGMREEGVGYAGGGGMREGKVHAGGRRGRARAGTRAWGGCQGGVGGAPAIDDPPLLRCPCACRHLHGACKF
jgi:hypothetical protein